MGLLKAPVLVAVLISCMSAVPSAAADDIPQVALLGFQLINTSLEPTTPAENQRIHMLDDLLQQKLEASGRFKVVPIPSDLRQEITAGPEISNCNGCQLDWARKVGADWAAWGTVQKVSNLILNINVFMEDARTGNRNSSRALIFAATRMSLGDEVLITCCAIIYSASLDGLLSFYEVIA